MTRHTSIRWPFLLTIWAAIAAGYAGRDGSWVVVVCAVLAIAASWASWALGEPS